MGLGYTPVGGGRFVDARGDFVSPAFQGPPKTNAQTQAQIEALAMQMAQAMLDEQAAAAQRATNGRVYTSFDTVQDVLPNNEETVTRGLFSGNTGSLVVMFTSSLLTATQKTYFQTIHSTGDPSANVNSNPELSIAYGHFAGSGSKDLTGNLNDDTPTRAIYKQYANLLLPPNDKKFTINGVDTDHIYILNFNRSRVREKLDPGNFELTLAQLSGALGVGANDLTLGARHTGSRVKVAGKNNYIQIIDDSSLTSPTLGEGGEIYNLVSGSIDNNIQIHNSANPVYYGLLYPQHGIAILNADSLDAGYPAGVNFGSVTASLVEGRNAVKLFTALSSSNGMTPNTVNGGIQARSSEQVKSTYYFVRVRNAEYNYSNNPSYVTGSLGELFFSSFINNPQVYITGVGLYNQRRELLAVAKLSQPLLKNFTREALIKVKLDF